MIRQTAYLFLVGWLIGCQSPVKPQPINPLPDNSSSGQVVAELNGVDFASQYAAQGWKLVVEGQTSPGGNATCFQPGVNIQISQFNANGKWLSNLSFWIRQDISKGRLKLNDPSACMPFVNFTTLDGDVSTGYFTLVSNADNRLVIDDYNQQNGELSGHFQCTFVPKGANIHSFLNTLDTLHFTNGQFKLKVAH